MEESSSKNQLPVNLTEDLLLEILSRVPYSSLCRFKCVSRSWLALCSDPDIRKKSPQTLSGFFYRSFMRPTYNPSGYRHHFTNVSGRGRPMINPSLSFLFLPTYASVEFVDCCNGLLLCHCRKISLRCEFDYVVCNPATEKWTVLPDTEVMHGICTVHLGFDPAVSSHFTVFLLQEFTYENEDEDEGLYHQIRGVEIYSSETGRWTYKQSGWDEKTRILGSSGLFFNGTLHLTTLNCSIIMVDIEGKKWRKIPTPYCFSFIGMSQGHLYAVHQYQNGSQLSIWVLEDYGAEQWGLKHAVNALELFGIYQLSFSALYPPTVIAIHPQCSLIFFIAGMESNLVSYDLDNKKVHAICALGDHSVFPFLPYIPCFSELLSDGTKS